MRSYKEHLNTIASSLSVNSKPVFRASAIFPVFHEPDFSSRLLFLGYWLLKRGVSNLTAVATLRSSTGELLDRTIFTIDEARAWRLEISEALAKINWKESSFIGSMEIEFFSAKNLVFPFPAVIVNYYGPHFSSMVHTAQRVFNNFEDMNNVMKASVPESGFNIIVDEKTKPFIAIVNGPEIAPHNEVKCTFYNQEGEILQHTWSLGDLNPYQTIVINPAEELDLASFFKGKPGTAKVYIDLPWIFPRLIAGNRHHRPSAAIITHTYYDCTEATTEGDYWFPSETRWHDATLGIPLLIDPKHTTKISLYPIYTPSEFVLGAEIYNLRGGKIDERPVILKVTPKSSSFSQIDFTTIFEQLKFYSQAPCMARITAKATGKRPIPARIKVAVDIGMQNVSLPCNICTNLIPFNPKNDDKPSTFRWLPIVEHPGATAWIINSGQQVNYTREAEITLTFYREQDCQTLIRKIVLPPNGSAIIERDHDEELKTFLGEKTGWLTVVANNPYVITYYFTENPAGFVGGDHGF